MRDVGQAGLADQRVVQPGVDEEGGGGHAKQGGDRDVSVRETPGAKFIIKWQEDREGAGAELQRGRDRGIEGKIEGRPRTRCMHEVTLHRNMHSAYMR